MRENLLSIFALLCLTITSAWAETIDLSKVKNDLTVADGDVLTGELAAIVQISIADGAKVTLNSAKINADDEGTSESHAGLTCLGDAIISLSGENIVKGFFENYPGIYVPKDKTLTIQGDGKLNASSHGCAPGIGGGYSLPCGNIKITNGIITAEGGNNSAGIGGCFDESCGSIEITGGTVIAIGGDYAPGIGSGNKGNCQSITINNGVTSVTATKGYESPTSIGAGTDGTCGTITIGGVVYPEGISESPYTYTSLTVDQAAVAAVIAKLKAIKASEYSEEAKILIKEAFVAYNALTEIQKGMLVTTITEMLTGTNDNTIIQAAQAFGIIQAIGEIEYNDVTKGLVDEIKKIYDSLDNLLKAKINNYYKQLMAAIQAYLLQQQINTSGAVLIYSPTAPQPYTYTSEIPSGNYSKIEYARTYGEDRVGKYLSWFLPFDYTITAADLEKFDFFKINFIANAGEEGENPESDKVYIFLNPVAEGKTLQGNMPYVYRPKEAVQNYRFTATNAKLLSQSTSAMLETSTSTTTYNFYGTYNNVTATAADPFYYVSINGTICYGTDVTIGPFRWLMKATNKNGNAANYARTINFAKGGTTGIDDVMDKRSDKTGDLYNLQGHKVAQHTKGLYIVNGRKVIIK